jgi:hypothetical protein
MRSQVLAMAAVRQELFGGLPKLHSVPLWVGFVPVVMGRSPKDGYRLWVLTSQAEVISPLRCAPTLVKAYSRGRGRVDRSLIAGWGDRLNRRERGRQTCRGLQAVGHRLPAASLDAVRHRLRTPTGISEA